jgi:hypothetical protein
MGRVGAELKIFGDGKIAKDAAAFGDEGDAQFGEIMRGATEDFFGLEGEVGAGFGPHKATENLQEGRLAGSIGAEDDDGFGRGNGNADAVEGEVFAIAQGGVG